MPSNVDVERLEPSAALLEPVLKGHMVNLGALLNGGRGTIGGDDLVGITDHVDEIV